MAKFTTEDKLIAVKRYLREEESYNSIARSMNTMHSTIKKWVAQYQFNGIEGLEKTYTSYTGQFKIDVLNYMNENRTSLNETAAIFKIPAPSTILSWQKTLETKGIGVLFSSKRG
ncbi:MAG TPA: transposase, partial [Rummeliibacillus sp.]|nr:transposase [Rummeliibacillus sp.]